MGVVRFCYVSVRGVSMIIEEEGWNHDLFLDIKAFFDSYRLSVSNYIVSHELKRQGCNEGL